MRDIRNPRLDPESIIDQQPRERTAQTHELKCRPEIFTAVQHWDKLFEIRHNDRNFKVGDVLWLREWNKATADYTGASVTRTISYITDFPSGLRDGYVCVGFYSDLPAMARRVVEQQQEIADLSACYLALPNLFKDVPLGDNEAIQKMRATVQHYCATFLKYEGERDKLAAQVEAATSRESDLIRESMKRVQENDALRKALAEAKSLVLGAKRWITSEPSHVFEIGSKTRWVERADALLATEPEEGAK